MADTCVLRGVGLAQFFNTPTLSVKVFEVCCGQGQVSGLGHSPYHF